MAAILPGLGDTLLGPRLITMVIRHSFGETPSKPM
jgi:hypothetical protein